MSSWKAKGAHLLNELRLHGMLLPLAVEAEVTGLAGMLGRTLFEIYADEEEGILHWVSTDHDRIEAAAERAEAALELLQAYRRDPTASRRKQE